MPHLSWMLALLLLVPQQATDVVVDAPPFADWLEGVRAEARARGVDEKVIAETLTNLAPLPRVVANDRKQAELTLSLRRYLQTRITPQVVRRGRELRSEHSTLLANLQQTYGVPAEVILAIWGLESRFGRNSGRTPVFQALATLAWEPRRSNFFRGELFNALDMVSRGYIDAASMTGSWAGAMGQTQFMPSSYLSYAVDFDGDGHRDIWRSTPDALASIANYLKGYGWKAGELWGREVTASAAVRARIEREVPLRTEGCYAKRTMTERRPLREWQRLGVRTLDGEALPSADMEGGLAEVGDRLFLLYPNYDVILGYNCAHYYALSVAMLADRL